MEATCSVYILKNPSSLWRTDNGVIRGKQGGYFRSLNDDGLNGMVVEEVVRSGVIIEMYL